MSGYDGDYSDVAHELWRFAPKFWSALRDVALEEAERLGEDRRRLEDELSQRSTKMKTERVGPRWQIEFVGKTELDIGLIPEETIGERMPKIGRPPEDVGDEA
jgi:hypothetical protein